MAQGLGSAQRSPATATPPATAPASAAASTPGEGVAAAGSDPEARLGQLKNLLDKGLISDSDFESAKAEVLKRLVG
jgi:membrane protease subunit (stomatin/prohibitin family)